METKLARFCDEHGWVCHLCKRSIPKQYHPNSPDAPSRDHVIARKKRPWKAFNRKPAHRWCNSVRGHRSIEELGPEAYSGLDEATQDFYKRLDMGVVA